MDTKTTTTTTTKDELIFEQRPPVRSLADSERLFQLGARTDGVLATINRRGFPHLTTVLYTWDPAEQVVRITTRVDRVKAVNAARDPRVALFVAGPDKWSFVVAEGRAEVAPVTTEAGDATGRELLAMFPQPDAAAEAAFLAEQVAEQRVVIRLHVDRLYGDIIELAA